MARASRWATAPPATRAAAAGRAASSTCRAAALRRAASRATRVSGPPRQPTGRARPGRARRSTMEATLSATRTATAASLLPGNFDHALKGLGDCFSCHQPTVAANAYVKYFNASGTLPGGDWAGGAGAPNNVRDPSQDVTVAAEIPTYAGTSITLVTVQAETLPMPMYHTSTA